MIKHEVSDLDKKITKFIGWNTPHPFSTSDSYIGVVKRHIEKLELSWRVRYHHKHAGKPYMCVIVADEQITGEADTENMSICLAFSNYIDSVSAVK